MPCGDYDTTNLRRQRIIAGFLRERIDRLFVHAVRDLRAQEREVHHDDVFGGFDDVLVGRRSGTVALLPVDYLEHPVPHHAIVLAREIHALFDLRAVGLDEPFARDLVGDLGDGLVGEATLEVFLEGGLQTSDADERVLGSFVANGSGSV